MEIIKKRIALLRDLMRRSGISACIVPGTDPHASEYIADCWKERNWISGFTGSAGTAVIALEQAGLWTDSRYFLQGESQLSTTGIDLKKQGVAGTPDIVHWLIKTLSPGQKVAVNPQMFSVNYYRILKAELQQADIELINMDLISEIWKERPSIPLNQCFLFDSSYTGATAHDKLTALREELKKASCDTIILSMLDEIAWLLNIRGTDVNYNPVTVSYVLVEADNAILFISPEKINKETRDSLRNQGIVVAPYTLIYDKIKSLPDDSRILFDGNKLNQSLYEAIPTQCKTINSLSPVAKLKSLKNQTEIEGFRRAMVKDGIALTRFFKWLEENVASQTLTEISIDHKLSEFRAEQPDSKGPSFGSIAGYAGHGAIVHYSATPETDATLLPDGIFLLDSGGQYLDGTTDITRTISLGNPTAQQKKDFSLVLKGNIALDQAIFPANTRGSQLDILARKALWSAGINYGHGTGHGVGHFLNVHEGPQSIRTEENPIVLDEGMVLSNEPAMYRTGEYGIRTENLILVTPAFTTEYASFFKFETLTLCYIDKNLMDFNILDSNDIQWINSYHQMVYDRIAIHLDEEEKAWLQQKCAPCKPL